MLQDSFLSKVRKVSVVTSLSIAKSHLTLGRSRCSNHLVDPLSCFTFIFAEGANFKATSLHQKTKHWAQTWCEQRRTVSLHLAHLKFVFVKITLLCKSSVALGAGVHLGAGLVGQLMRPQVRLIRKAFAASWVRTLKWPFS